MWRTFNESSGCKHSPPPDGPDSRTKALQFLRLEAKQIPALTLSLDGAFVVDAASGLVWARCLYGQQWDGEPSKLFFRLVCHPD
jgi:hypothetical protein